MRTKSTVFILCLVAPPLLLFVACLSSNPDATSPDASSIEASTTDSRLPFDDGSTGSDGGRDASTTTDERDADAGGGCSSADSASSCVTCCETASPSSGFELAFFQQCELCGASCQDKRPCGTNLSPPAGGACVGCLQPKVNSSASGWTQCQASAACKAFVACLTLCPTN